MDGVALQTVMRRAPWLGHVGVLPATARAHVARWPRTAQAPFEDYLAKERDALICALREVQTAYAYLSARPEGRAWRCSYALKHSAEHWGRAVGMEPYVANGSLIAAAVHLGLHQKQVGNGPNTMIYFGTQHFPKLSHVWSVFGTRSGVAELEIAEQAPALP